RNRWVRGAQTEVSDARDTEHDAQGSSCPPPGLGSAFIDELASDPRGHAGRERLVCGGILGDPASGENDVRVPRCAVAQRCASGTSVDRPLECHPGRLQPRKGLGAELIIPRNLIPTDARERYPRSTMTPGRVFTLRIEAQALEANGIECGVAIPRVA